MIVMICLDPYGAGLLGCVAALVSLTMYGIVMLLEWAVE